MTTVSVSKEFNVAPTKLWEKVKAFNNMHQYLPSMITSCHVHGSGAGAKRTCGTEQGNILETLTSLNDSNMTLQYTIDNEDAPLPVSNYAGTATVKNLGDELAEFSWSATFDAKGMPEADVVSMLEGAFNDLLNNIAASIEK